MVGCTVHAESGFATLHEQEFASAFSTVTSGIQDMLWREMHIMGINPSWKYLSDAEYIVATKYLDARRKKVCALLGSDNAKRYNSLRRMISHHLEQCTAPTESRVRQKSTQDHSPGTEEAIKASPDTKESVRSGKNYTPGPLALGLAKQR